MDWEWNGIQHTHCAVIFKVKDEWGALSNMHNDFLLRVNRVQVASSEALYQAMRFPHQPPRFKCRGICGRFWG